jgi:hypothetical protein
VLAGSDGGGVLAGSDSGRCVLAGGDGGGATDSATSGVCPDFDAVVALHVAGPWLFMMSGGPSVDVLDRKLHGGWSAQLGVAWQP